MNNENLYNLNGLSACTNLEYLYAYRCYNNTSNVYTGLNDISGISNCKRLKRLYIYQNLALTNLNTLSSINTLEFVYAYSCNITDITGISGMTNLKYLSLYSNANLNQVSTLETLTGLTSLYLANNENMDMDQVISALDDTGILAQCGVNYSIPDKYLENFTALVGEYLLADKGLTDNSDIIQKFLKRSDVTNIKRLDLSGNSELTDTTLQTMLKRMKNLQVLSLRGCSNLESIDFISEGNVEGLYELDLRDTNVTDLGNLENYGMNLAALILNNYNTDFSKIQNTINRFNSDSRESSLSFSMGSSMWSYYCTGLILTGDASEYSFGENCSNITKIFMGQCSFTDLQSGTLDLSKLPNLTEFFIRFAGYSIKLPSSLTSFTHMSGDFSCDLSGCYNLQSVELDDYQSSYMGAELSSLTKMPYEIEIIRRRCNKFRFLKK